MGSNPLHEGARTKSARHSPRFRYDTKESKNPKEHAEAARAEEYTHAIGDGIERDIEEAPIAALVALLTEMRLNLFSAERLARQYGPACYRLDRYRYLLEQVSVAFDLLAEDLLTHLSTE